LDAPRDLELSDSSETSLTINWRRPRAKIDHYRLNYVSADSPQEEVVVPGDATSYTINSLNPGMQYNISLVAERGRQKSNQATLSASTASFTRYIADSVPELTATNSSEENKISFLSIDTSDPESSGMGQEDEKGALKVSGITSDGFLLSWESEAYVDSYIVECRDVMGLWDKMEVKIHGDATGTRIQGLKASTAYQVRLYGTNGIQRSSLLETIAVTEVPSVQSLVGTTGAGPNHSSSDLPGEVMLTSISNVGSPTQSSPGTTQAPADGSLDNFLVEVDPRMEPTVTHETGIPLITGSPPTDGSSTSTSYNVSVYRIIEAEPSPSPKADFVTENEAEPLVMNLTVSDVTWGSFHLSWNATGVVAFDGFLIEVADLEGTTESQNHTLSGDTWSLGITHLSPNTSYRISLRGLYRGSLLEATLSEATTVPEPTVGTLLVSNVTPESFTISWNGTEGNFEGYVLEIIDSNWLLEPTEYNLSHNALSHDIEGLSPSTDYIAYLYGVLKGVRTQAVSTVATTEPDLGKLVVSNITSDRLSISWRTGAKAFDNFVVEIRESAQPLRAMGRTLSGAARSTVISGLRGDTQYSIKLYGSTGRQNTPPLTAVATTEPNPQLGSLAVSSISPDNFTLSWSSVAGHFDGFVVRVSDSEQLYDTLELQLPGNARNSTVAGLVDATAYDIELYGISHGRRTPSLSAHATTAELPKVENLNISEISPFGFRVSWTARDREQPGEFDHFHLVVTDSGWLLDPQEFIVPGNQTSLDIRGLITGIGYEVRLTGVTRSGLQSRPLTTVAVTEAEPEVDHLFVSDITSESFRLAWTAEDDIFDRFLIKVRDSKKIAHPKEISVSGAARTKIIKGLSGGTEYDIELYGMTLERRSQPVMGVARTGLGSVRGISFSDVTNSSAKVNWNKPRNPVDSYRVIYVPQGGGNPLTVIADGSVTEVQLPNLTPGVTYEVTVVTVKGLEESDPASKTVTAALDKPRGLTAVNVTDSKALLLWQPVIANVDGYVIAYSSDSASPTVEQVSGNTVEFQMTGLTPATKYSVSVRSVKGGQNSDAANTEFTTGMDAPRDLKVANIQAESAVLTWTPPHSSIEGYILKYETPDGTLRVRVERNLTPGLNEVALNPEATTYTLTPLNSSTRYVVRLQANVGPNKSRPAGVTFTTSDMLYNHPKDCSQTLLNGDTSNGQYIIYLGGQENQPSQVFCDMTTDSGGWIVFLRRRNGKVDFYRNWKNYTEGFGDPEDEFWLAVCRLSLVAHRKIPFAPGLEKLHKITSSGQYELRVDLRDQGESVYALYDSFSVLDARSRYRVRVGRYSGTAGDSMTYHHGRPFSTYDKDNDIAVTNCALSYKGAFWYENCHRVNLMGRYGDNSHSKGVNWYHWKGHEHSIEFAEMKIRPVNFRNLEGRRKRS
ncbi:tenascin-like, partial [Scleropages formosus]